VTRLGALIGALCAAIVAAIFLADPTLLGYEWLLHDVFTRRIAKHHPGDPRVMIVPINRATDERLASEFGRPPYPRSVDATVVRELRRAGAAVIAFDMSFPDHDPDAESDREFAAEISGAPVVLGVDTHARGEKEPPTQPGAFADRMWRIAGGRGSWNARLPIFPETPAIGTMRMPERKEGAVHSYLLADRVTGDLHVPSLALEAARMFMKAERSATWRGDHLDFAGARVPVDRDRNLILRWSTFMDDAHVVDFYKVLTAGTLRDQNIDNPQVPLLEARFRGKIVLIAYTTQGMHDLRATPLDQLAAGVEIHANAIANLINGDFNRAANRWLIALLMIAFGALTGGIVHAIKAQVPAGIVGITAIAIWLAAGFATLSVGVVIPTVAGATSAALTYVVITVIKLTFEQRQTARIRATFGRYVSPQILQYILANPDKVHLGGERRDLTILFSDIRGFTTISEGSEPEQVVEMLNEYLTRMVEILLAHGGTLDKFIGDAVMGFWNAPTADPEHARHAVACALEMIEETARIRERWEKEGKASIRIGIGVNTGDAVVGNIGAEKVFSYTVIGDAVNLASRLEGKNKDYGTEIIISEFTKARIGEEFELVYLDDVKVKGKEKAVRIFEVKGKTHVA
jgi:adenylate cyclase